MVQRKLFCAYCGKELKFLPREEMFELGMAIEIDNGYGPRTYYHCAHHKRDEVKLSVMKMPRGFTRASEIRR